MVPCIANEPHLLRDFGRRRHPNACLHAARLGDGRAAYPRLSAAGAEDAFASLVVTPPAWMFSRDWDAVRLTVRGVDEQAENVSVQFNADPWVLIMR